MSWKEIIFRIASLCDWKFFLYHVLSHPVNGSAPMAHCRNIERIYLFFFSQDLSFNWSHCRTNLSFFTEHILSLEKFDSSLGLTIIGQRIVTFHSNHKLIISTSTFEKFYHYTDGWSSLEQNEWPYITFVETQSINERII